MCTEEKGVETLEKGLHEIGKGKDADLTILEQVLQEKENMPHFIEMLAANRMCGLAYVILRDKELLSLLNREYRSVLEAVYLYGRERNQSFHSCKKEIARQLNLENIEYVALKGAYLTELYPKGTRISNDLDILIMRQDISRVTELLKSNGFMQGFIRNEKIVPATRNEIVNALLHRGETIPFVKEINQPCMKFLEIDVNLSLDGKADERQIVEKEMLEHRVQMKGDSGEALYILDSVDFLIQLCVHLYKEATNELWIERGMDWTLYKFTDIYLYCKEHLNKAYIGKLLQRIKQYGLERECYFSLYHMYYLLYERRDLDKCVSEVIYDQKREEIGQILTKILMRQSDKGVYK